MSSTTAEENVLNSYASYNYIFTLSGLTPKEIENARDIVRSEYVPHDVIAKSGGIGGEGNYSPFGIGDPNFAKTIYNQMEETALSKSETININERKNSDRILKRGHDIFIEKVTINSTYTANPYRKLSALNTLEIEMTEPLGVTLFEKYRAAANNCGYTDWTDAPFLLTLEFRGFNEKGKELGVIPRSKRQMVIKINKCPMKISSAGTSYTQMAVAYSEFAFIDRFNKTRTAGQVPGNPSQGNSTILNNNGIIDPNKGLRLGEAVDINNLQARQSPRNPTYDLSRLDGALNSLANELNKSQIEEQKEPLREFIDEYRIIVEPGVGQSIKDAANHDIDGVGKDGRFKFSWGRNEDITNIITNVVLNCDEYRNIKKKVEKFWQNFDKSQLDQIEPQTVNPLDFMVPWFKISSSVETKVTEWDTLLNMHPKIITYRVKPYLVHILNFTVVGLIAAESTFAKTVKKAYKYIFTGENTEITDLELDYDASWHQARLYDGSRSDGNTRDQKDTSLKDKIKVSRLYGNATFTDSLREIRGFPSTVKDEDGNTEDGASRTDTDEFMNYLTDPAKNMILIDMTILGDPAWIGQDTWLPVSSSTDTESVTYKSGAVLYHWDDKTGSFNLDQAEPFLTLEFKFPTDINEKKGTMDFTGLEDIHFNGLYKSYKVRSVFNRGLFTQVLSLQKYNNQGKISSRPKPLQGSTDNTEATPKFRLENLVGSQISLVKQKLNKITGLN